MWVIGLIVGFFAICMVIVGLFNDKINSIGSAVIAIILLVICICLHANGTLAEMMSDISESILKGGLEEGKSLQSETDIRFTIYVSLGFLVLMLVRYLPCISIETEKNTYLIFGTLIENTESRIVGLLGAILVPIVWAVGFYIVAAVLTNWWSVFFVPYAAIIIYLAHSVIGFIRALVEG